MTEPLIYVLLSGGIDSTTALARACDWHGDGNVRAVSINYGQRHSRELIAAQQVAKHYNIPHSVLKLEIASRTMLTSPDVQVPDVSYAEIRGVSPTYVPFRNGMMLSRLAAHISELHLDPTREGTPDYNRDCQIHWGAHAEDAAGGAYPDCTPEFIGAMTNAIYIGTYHKVRMVAPFIYMMKNEIIQQGSHYGAPYHLTWSCYKGGVIHCGTCATCRARKEAFRLACVSDPTQYVEAL